MDRAKILALYDTEMRQDPPEEPGTVIDRTLGVVRLVGPRSWIAYSRLTAQDATEVVNRETARFRLLGVELEWKLFAQDGPSWVGELLATSGYVPDPPETLMALDLEDDAHPPELSTGSNLERVTSPESLREAVRASSEAFAPDEGWDLAEYLPRLGTPSFEVVVARVDGIVVATGRLELPPERSFASLWGGGTLPPYRGQGWYRALVAMRAGLARSRGYRYLTVDARETSRPILERLGFEPLTRMVGWVLRPASSASDRG